MENAGEKDGQVVGSSKKSTILVVCFLIIIAAVFAFNGYVKYRRSNGPEVVEGSDRPSIDEPAIDVQKIALRKMREREPRSIGGKFSDKHQVTLWWDTVPAKVHATCELTGIDSNIHPDDYAGPESCKKCHAENYDSWSKHSHRWMNAVADKTSLMGDFSGQTIDYLGGTATFYQENGECRMKLERGDVRRVLQVKETIGSRFFQYYVGLQLEGPEPKEHVVYRSNHVFPFGYWMDAEEWVPTVHVEEEQPDGERNDPYREIPLNHPVAQYTRSCNHCHTTYPLADMISRNPQLMAQFTPTPLHFSLATYLREAHPELMQNVSHPADLADSEVDELRKTVVDFEASTHAVTHGISCEACHLGAKEHVLNKKIKPKFFPSSPHLYAQGEVDFGRTNENVNWACGRCHAGSRPYYAGGMATWNSTECSDAMRGACYSELRCVDCHNPHKSIGPKWKRTPEQDDAICLKCHEQFEQPETRQQHTHHSAGSEGTRCMNCHMPRINEGLQDVVRTHTIFKPTNKEMIESNQLNACNMCHTDQPIDWTLTHLKDWYGAEYSEKKLAKAYTDRSQPVGLGWMASENESVRLVAADALLRTDSKWAMPQLADALDDPYLLNRQFARIGLERLIDIKLKDFGYHFYMLPEERREPVSKIREELLRLQTELPATSED